MILNHSIYNRDWKNITLVILWFGFEISFKLVILILFSDRWTTDFHFKCFKTKPLRVTVLWHITACEMLYSKKLLIIKINRYVVNIIYFTFDIWCQSYRSFDYLDCKFENWSFLWTHRYSNRKSCDFDKTVIESLRLCPPVIEGSQTVVVFVLCGSINISSIAVLQLQENVTCNFITEQTKRFLEPEPNRTQTVRILSHL